MLHNPIPPQTHRTKLMPLQLASWLMPLLLMTLLLTMTGCVTSAPVTEKPSYKDAPKEVLNKHEQT